ncbi:unnamed protein product [Amaranthus hypochondriacus]
MEMDYWVSMPKVELHAHLNGSVRDSTLLYLSLTVSLHFAPFLMIFYKFVIIMLHISFPILNVLVFVLNYRELAKELGEKGIILFSDVEHVILKNDRSLTEVFKMFDLIHILTTDHDTVTRITKEVVEDFASENVVYLELRTTPKRNESRGMTKHSYMEAVVEGLRRVDAVNIDFASTETGLWKKETSCQRNNECGCLSKRKIYVRLLLSIDRRETLEAAMETVKLALEMRNSGVVGIDLSGNPKVGEWTTFLPALRFAREQGLRVTLHCGEYRLGP